MAEFKYTDRRGLEIHPGSINEMLAAAGLHRKAFESAAISAALEPWQAVGLLEVYGHALEWYTRNPNDTRPQEWIRLDGFTQVRANG